MSVRAVALAATPGVNGRYELCMGGKQVVESAQHEGAAFELELAQVCDCKRAAYGLLLGSDAASGYQPGLLLSVQPSRTISSTQLALGATPAIERLLLSLRETWRCIGHRAGNRVRVRARSARRARRALQPLGLDVSVLCQD